MAAYDAEPKPRGLGLILRAEIVWAKPNGLPESVTDRVRRAHEQVFHFTRQPRYYAAVDEIREPHAARSLERYRLPYADGARYDAATQKASHAGTVDANPLGKLPGSVWEIPSAPLQVPARLGVDHFAAFPPALVRPLVLGWSPPGVCTACGQGRRPVVDRERETYYGDGRYRNGAQQVKDGAAMIGWRHDEKWGAQTTITGYACACTPYTDHPIDGSSGEGYNRPGEGIDAGHRITFPDTPGPPSRLGTRPKVSGGREYHFENWQPPATRPAVVLDPFGGTGTTALVASAYGRHGITVDLSAGYCRLAAWRVHDPGERARARAMPKPPPIPDGQEALFTM
jgi:hypothetical protein